MPRPSGNGAGSDAHSLARSKLASLRAFLILEAIKGHPHALKVLGELPLASGKVSA